ncbi:hypothetical protein PENTCL1PPCAC_25619, partial [Pristionchus entomophagus]
DKMADERTKEAVETAFLSSGERERVKDLLQSRLREHGWNNEVKRLCRECIKTRGIEGVSVEEIYNDVRGEARSKVPDEVKRELLAVVSSFVRKQLDLEEM